MFSKRRRAASNPAQRAAPSASASLAATKAFVKDRESNSNLSNAAAAAALRSLATTPTPVGETVTKRMARRNSASSIGSGAVRPGLQRQNSAGSMTERSFRNPSPGRGSPADPNAPPVPAVPTNLSPASRGGGRPGPRATSNLSQVVEDEHHAGQRSSVNFSRPMSPASAAQYNASPQTSNGWFGGPVVNREAVQRMASTSRPKTSSGVPGADVRYLQQSVQDAANRPVRTHQLSHGAEGSRLSIGSMRAKPSGTAIESRSYLPQHPPQPTRGPVDPNSPDAIFDPSTRTFIHKQDAMARHRELQPEPEERSVHDYVAQHLDTHAPQQTQSRNVLPRTPSPVHQPVPFHSVHAVQKREEMALPKLDTGARVRRPEDPPTGFPRHEAEDTPVLSRQHSEEFAVADVHPGPQVDSNREPGKAAAPEQVESMGSSKLAVNQASAYPRIPTSVIPTTSNTLAGQGRGSARSAHDRAQSLSPPRNAHFASVAVELSGAKHQPPPRSISPAKSALKSSPSVSRRGSSPVTANGRLLSKGSPSETSDTTSEGGTMRQKKEVRVSFEEAPVIAGTSAYADIKPPTSPTGLGASKWSPTREKDNEFEDFMKPRPALPSFGSIRGKEKRGREAEVAEKVTETVASTPMTASVGSINEPVHSSSDHAIAGIVAQDFAQKQAKHDEPLPPEVTSVEGTGYVSDSSDDIDGSPGIRKHGAVDDSSQILPEPKSLSIPHEEKPSTPASTKEQVVDVPQIALLPATPSPFERPEPQFQPMAVPGGWDEDALERNVGVDSSLHAVAEEPKSTPVAQHVSPPTTLRELIDQDDDDSSDDNSSIYSDAYEDLSDAEGGFGSIDALMESPVVPSASALMFPRHADKGAADGPKSGLRNEVSTVTGPEPAIPSDHDWDMARQHWSGLNESRKQTQPGRQTDISVGSTYVAATTPRENLKQTETPTPARVEPSAMAVQTSQISPQKQQTTKPLKSALKKSAAAQLAQTAEPQMRKTMRGSAPRQERTAEPQMRTTMRDQSLRDDTASEPHMRKTMRGGAEPTSRVQPQIRSTMRGSSPIASSPAGLAASRHSTINVEAKSPRGALQKRHIPASAMVPRPQSIPVAPGKPLASAPTYDSDSDASASSFQRSRARRNVGQRSMRSSMRTGPAPTMRSAAPAQVRSISPPGSPSPAMRKSMRPSSPTPDVPKSSRFSIRSLSPMGRFRTSKPIEAAPAPTPATPPKRLASSAKQAKPKSSVPERAKPAFKSRFADSSDEDDDHRPAHFQSRFADSDDEDEPMGYQLPPGLAPVRGIPKRAGEEDGDSTDLEEEAEERPKPAPALGKQVGSGTATNAFSKAPINGNTNGQGTVLSSGSLRDSKHAPAMPSFEASGKAKSRRGFFGLGKKKTAPTLSAAGLPETSAESATDATPEIPMPPQHRNRETGLPLTPIEEDKDIGTPVQSSPVVKKSPKLQRRSTPEWPLPRNNIPVPPIPDSERPMSSDGISFRRPRFQNRQSSQMSNITTATAPIVNTSGHSVAYGRDGKKKKFQGLRKVFGLND